VYQNWKEICDQGQCGPDLAIIPISRSTNSGIRFTFEKYVLKGVATVPGLGLERTSGIPGAVQEVEGNPGSISYTSLSRASAAPDVTIVTIDGHDPHNTSLIQNNQYQFWNIEHMYTRGQGSPLAQAFINYMYSDFAQKLLPLYAMLRLTDVPLDIRQKRT
jgi:phosphate transport system substrate-binding protein